MSNKLLIFLFLIVLLFLHQDFWFKDDPSLVFGFLPVTLAYHMVFTVVAAIGWLMVVKFAWPKGLDEEGGDS
ncbi:MAG: hypothetical protein CMI18_12040 [Opitutaceae bacterium]|nr:hypothetical protein [Opitutaceae bacterium]|tara:strand:- start:4031 stop:4246 length:216 start_codon:yes stop_codon:yes gene_type:complete